MHEANPRYRKALRFAVEAHDAAKQARKGTDFPYVLHPIRVAEILDRFGCSDDTVVAGFLHDTVEDTDVSLKDIERRFGKRVARLVQAASEPDKGASWQDRKDHTIHALASETDTNVLALVAADKLDNVRASIDMVQRVGADVFWSRFNAPVERQAWYYRSVADAILSHDPANALYRELHCEVRSLFPDADPRTTAQPAAPEETAERIG